MFMRVHLYGFRDARIELGISAEALGLGTVLDADRSDGATRMSLSAGKITATLGADGQTLNSPGAD